MSSIHTKAIDWLEQLESGACTSTEITQLYLDQIERHEGTIQAFLQVNRDAALQQARDIDQRRKDGQPVGRLAGLPVAIKDLVDVAGVRTTYGSPIFANHVPETSHPLVERIERKGGVVIAKSNTPEFGAGGSTFNEVFG